MVATVVIAVMLLYRLAFLGEGFENETDTFHRCTFVVSGTDNGDVEDGWVFHKNIYNIPLEQHN